MVKEGARTREYEDALQWLMDARLVYKIYRSSAPGLPIAAYDVFPEKVKLRIRFSLDNLKLDNDVLNIPLFMAEQAERLIGLALEHMETSIIRLKS